MITGNQTNPIKLPLRPLAVALLVMALIPIAGRAAYLRNYPVSIVQPDGRAFDVFATGDEFRHRVHDAYGYTILKNPRTGSYVYAVRQNGRVVPSNFEVGRLDSRALGKVLNLTTEAASTGPVDSLRSYGSPLHPEEIQRAPNIASFDNVVVFIRFSDETEFADPITLYGALFDMDASGYNSLYNYFREVSYGGLTIRSFFCPFPNRMEVVSYQDSHKRSYFQPYDSRTNTEGYQNGAESAYREQILLRDAIQSLIGQISLSLNIDGNHDGYVDNVCFVIKGSPDAWGDLLWPHMWSLYLVPATINDKVVSTYNFQLENSLKRSGTGVLCHEMFHSLGSPDLYHYDDDGLNPVGKWDLMDYDLNPPQHMGAHMKYKYGGWIDSVPEITASGYYTLHPLTSSTNNCYKIRSPASATEYFVVEYRKKTGTFESSLPGEGLLVYRINTKVSGNADGPPDEVYVYRPNGTLTNDGQVNQANYSLDVGRTAINDATNPAAFLSNGSLGHLDISQVGSAGDTITFWVTIAPSPAPAPAEAGAPAVAAAAQAPAAQAGSSR